MSEQSKASRKILREVSDIYTKKYGMKYAGIFVAAPGGVYKDIGISFEYIGHLTKDQARIILLDVAEALLDRINNDSVLKPHLKSYPFTGKNVTVDIFIISPDGNKLYYPDIKIVSFYGDKLRYKYDTPETENSGNYFLIETETIEEARQIVNQQNNR